jgi:hypothetical protein
MKQHKRIKPFESTVVIIDENKIDISFYETRSNQRVLMDQKRNHKTKDVWCQQRHEDILGNNHFFVYFPNLDYAIL